MFGWEGKHEGVIMTNVYKIGEEMKSYGYTMEVVIHITALLSELPASLYKSSYSHNLCRVLQRRKTVQLTVMGKAQVAK